MDKRVALQILVVVALTLSALPTHSLFNETTELSYNINMSLRQFCCSQRLKIPLSDAMPQIRAIDYRAHFGSLSGKEILSDKSLGFMENR